jgi:hypothetical protein
MKLPCVNSIEGLAATAGAQGDILRAVRLWSSAAAIRQALGTPLPPINHSRRDSAIAQLRAQLDEATFAATWAEGQTLTLEQVIAYALEPRPDSV